MIMKPPKLFTWPKLTFHTRKEKRGQIFDRVNFSNFWLHQSGSKCSAITQLFYRNLIFKIYYGYTNRGLRSHVWQNCLKITGFILLSSTCISIQISTEISSYILVIMLLFCKCMQMSLWLFSQTLSSSPVIKNR